MPLCCRALVINTRQPRELPGISLYEIAGINPNAVVQHVGGQRAGPLCSGALWQEPVEEARHVIQLTAETAQQEERETVYFLPGETVHGAKRIPQVCEKAAVSKWRCMCATMTFSPYSRNRLEKLFFYFIFLFFLKRKKKLQKTSKKTIPLTRITCSCGQPSPASLNAQHPVRCFYHWSTHCRGRTWLMYVVRLSNATRTTKHVVRQSAANGCIQDGVMERTTAL